MKRQVKNKKEPKCMGKLAHPTASSCGVVYLAAFFAATGARDRRTRRVTAHLIGFEGPGLVRSGSSIDRSPGVLLESKASKIENESNDQTSRVESSHAPVPEL